MRCLSNFLRTTALGVLLAASAAASGGATEPTHATGGSLASKWEAEDAAPSRILLHPDEAGALKVEGIQSPDEVLMGLYFPTSESINGGTAYKKEDFGTEQPSGLWIARDPTGYWCIQPTEKKGTPDALMISKHHESAMPEDISDWQLWSVSKSQWQVQPSVSVVRCQNGNCDGDVETGPSPGPAVVVPGPAPAPLPPAFDNSPGKSILTPIHLQEETTDTYSYRLWAALVFGGILLAAGVCCLLNSENQAARSYVYCTTSSTLALVIGILVASQIVPLLTLGRYRTCWVIELILFVIGFCKLHWLCWKCQYSPVRRTVIWAFGGNFVGALGVVTYLDLREAIFATGWADDVLLAFVVLLGMACLLKLLHLIMKKVDSTKLAEPSEASWPPSSEAEKAVEETEGAVRSWTTRSCWPGGPETKAGEAAQSDMYHNWRDDALRAEYTACSICLAFVIYNLFRAIANSFGQEYIYWSWAIILLVVIAIIFCIHRSIRSKTEKGGTKDWHADILIVGTLARVLGICVVGAMRKVNPGLRQNLQEFFGINALAACLLEVLLVSFLTKFLISIMSRNYTDDDERDTYGVLSVVHEYSPGYPEEVVGFAIAIAIAWSVFFSALLGDFVRSSDWLYWIVPSFLRNQQMNEVWFHAFFCIFLASMLYLFWRRFVLRRMMMNVKAQGLMIRKENEVYDDIKEMRASW